MLDTVLSKVAVVGLAFATLLPGIVRAENTSATVPASGIVKVTYPIVFSPAN